MTTTAPAPVRTFPAPPFASEFVDSEAVGDIKSMIIYGEPGTWKTTVGAGICRVPKFANGKGLIIDIDNGTEVLSNEPDIQAKIASGQINIFPIDKTSIDAWGKLEYIINEVVNTDYGYDWVMLDTLDVAQEVVIEHLLATTLNDKGQPDTRGAWGKVSAVVGKWMWAFQNTSHFVGVTVMHSKDGTDDGGAFKIKPKLAGSLKDNLAGIPSLVAYVDFREDSEKVTHLVATIGKSSITSTKNRYKMVDDIWDFDLPKLYATIESREEVAHSATVTPATV